jgi:hypothetical protein
MRNRNASYSGLSGSEPTFKLISRALLFGIRQAEKTMSMSREFLRSQQLVFVYLCRQRVAIMCLPYVVDVGLCRALMSNILLSSRQVRRFYANSSLYRRFFHDTIKSHQLALNAVSCHISRNIGGLYGRLKGISLRANR